MADLENEIKWHKSYLKFAKEISKHSKCAAKQVGCIIVKDGSVLSIGINGTKSGSCNCNDLFLKEDDVWYRIVNITDISVYPNVNHKEFVKCKDQEEHHNWSLQNEIHAEMNAIKRATSNRGDISGSTLYCTHLPCVNCAKTIVLYDIKEIVYINDYDNRDETIKYLNRNSVKVTNIIIK